MLFVDALEEAVDFFGEAIEVHKGKAQFSRQILGADGWIRCAVENKVSEKSEWSGPG